MYYGSYHTISVKSRKRGQPGFLRKYLQFLKQILIAFFFAP